MKDYNYDEALYIIHTRSQSIRGINTSLIIHNTLMLELTRNDETCIVGLSEATVLKFVEDICIKCRTFQKYQVIIIRNFGRTFTKQLK